MDTASAITMKTLNFLPTTITTQKPNSTSQTQPTKSNSNSNSNSNSLNVHISNTRTRRSKPISLTRCSTKPDTNTDNPKDQNSTVEEANPNPNPINPPPLTSANPLSTSVSPSPSSKGGLVFDLGSHNSWDAASVGSPVVKRFLGDEEERWYMWYHGNSDSEQPGSDSIGLAVSSNGVHWNRGVGAVQSSQDVGLVMSKGKDWWGFDTLSIRPCEVVVMSSSKVRGSSAVYWMYYVGFSPEKAVIAEEAPVDLENPEGFKSLVGLAMSQDGRHWARIEGDHHSGALFDVGLEKDWDSSFVAGCHVVFHERGDLRMYYHSFDSKSGGYGIGIARSRDGMKWIKMGKIIGGGRKGGFNEMGAMNPSVVRKRGSGEYLMAYEGIDGNGERSIGLAVSRDGLKEWTRCGDAAVLKASEEESGWDGRGVGAPCLVQMEGEDDEWRLYYRGVGNGGRTGIGMAVSEGNDYSRFRRWEGFHL